MRERERERKKEIKRKCIHEREECIYNDASSVYTLAIVK